MKIKIKIANITRGSDGRRRAQKRQQKVKPAVAIAEENPKRSKINGR
jgi:hypothetical protein